MLPRSMVILDVYEYVPIKNLFWNYSYWSKVSVWSMKLEFQLFRRIISKNMIIAFSYDYSDIPKLSDFLNWSIV